MAENINCVEWDAKHRNYLIRLVGDEKSQEEHLAKMMAAEEMYKALKDLTIVCREVSYNRSALNRAKQALAKAKEGQDE